MYTVSEALEIEDHREARGRGGRDKWNWSRRVPMGRRTTGRAEGEGGVEIRVGAGMQWV